MQTPSMVLQKTNNAQLCLKKFWKVFNCFELLKGLQTLLKAQKALKYSKTSQKGLMLEGFNQVFSLKHLFNGKK